MIKYKEFDCKGTIHCDGCPDSEEYDAYSFVDLVNQAKKEGWIIHKDDTQWIHYCSRECENKDAK